MTPETDTQSNTDTQAPDPQPAPVTLPTVGRRVHFRRNGADIAMTDCDKFCDEPQPMDAGIAYAWPPLEGELQIVNITVADHFGVTRGLTSVPFRQPHDPRPPHGTPYVEWMPYQQSKHAAEKAEPAPVAAPASTEPSTVTPSGAGTQGGEGGGE